MHNFCEKPALKNWKKFRFNAHFSSKPAFKIVHWNGTALYKIKITCLFSATCENEWQEYNIGGRNYCFKAVGVFKAVYAGNACKSFDASLPLPESDAENEDLRVAMADLGQDYAFIGISDYAEGF